MYGKLSHIIPLIIISLALVQCEADNQALHVENFGERAGTELQKEKYLDSQDFVYFKEKEAELETREGNVNNEEGNNEEEKIVYLTFDDGPSVHTREILDILDAYNAHATFFVNGRESGEAVQMYEAIINEGHVLGNHTYTHEYDKIYSDVEEFKADVLQLENYIKEITGERTNFFRFPGGSNSSMAKKYGGEQILHEARAALSDLGYVFFDWDVDSGDSTSNELDAIVIANQTLEQVKGRKKAIALFHDGINKQATVEALPIILSELKSWGYTFKTLSETSPRREFHL
ncbi:MULTISPECIES: polysaccharide deacetylase family protein [Bacillaceae]|uniref:Polysaccharide deacetylase n=1 Tax=Evansella alkalicola TaxID=745819 RepID=A0ABS6K2K0_9BACI|nr:MULTISPECIES: polysaccharide deacetylase family protein [Bacillaceae]MBU9724302.1 polysaccharide deacetylase [Bacillus alkalicola]